MSIEDNNVPESISEKVLKSDIVPKTEEEIKDTLRELEERIEKEKEPTTEVIEPAPPPASKQSLPKLYSDGR